jgi:hypothetical protein
LENLKARDHLGDLGKDGDNIKMDVMELDMKMRTGFIFV